MSVISSLSEALTPQFNERTSKCLITMYSADDEQGETRALQYFPESLTDSKAVNWAPKDIPGGSLPIYQWVSSGERTISFAAVFSCDVDFSKNPELIEMKIKAAGLERRNVDIRSAVAWLRSFTLPSYDRFTAAPRKLLLALPGTGIGLAGGSQFGDDDAILAIMTECSVEWTSFFPSGQPRLATANLTFAQIAQFRGEVNFPDRDAPAVYGLTGGGNSSIRFLGYKLR